MNETTIEEFLNVVNYEIEKLPSEFKEKLDNVSIQVEDLPTEIQYRKIYKSGSGGMLLGLYEGIPHTKRRNYGVGGAIPDKITLFRLPLMHISRDEKHLKSNIKSTLLHEIAHHFGMDEDAVRKAQGKS